MATDDSDPNPPSEAEVRLSRYVELIEELSDLDEIILQVEDETPVESTVLLHAYAYQTSRVRVLAFQLREATAELNLLSCCSQCRAQKPKAARREVLCQECFEAAAGHDALPFQRGGTVS